MPIPAPSPLPAGGKDVASFVAGINLAVFKNTKNMDGALKFVKFMTSAEEQKILNKTSPPCRRSRAARSTSPTDAGEAKAFADVLATTAAPLPQVPGESPFETLVGTAVKDLFADAAAGKAVTDADIKAALQEAQQQMAGGRQ